MQIYVRILKYKKNWIKLDSGYRITHTSKYTWKNRMLSIKNIRSIIRSNQSYIIVNRRYFAKRRELWEAQ